MPDAAPLPPVFLIDDDEVFCLAMSKALRRRGFAVSVPRGGDGALEALRGAPRGAVVVLDLRMPERSGLELLRLTPRREAAVLMLTGHGGVPDAVEAMRAGAHTFITKPVDAADLAPLIEEAARARAEPARATLIGDSDATRRLRRVVERLAGAREPILLTGETGTGKEVVARALHAEGPYAAEPFVAVNMACLPRDLLEAELFGHKRGAFTGAHADKRGLFEEAGGGTLFLDEVAELPLEHQAKLLRVIEGGEFRPVGATHVARFAGRLIAATHRDLAREVRAGRFREDLLYRLQVLPVHIAPLRERLDDLEPILRAWLERLCPAPVALSPSALRALRQHPWAGNVRELVNLARRVAVFHPDGGQVGAEFVEQMLHSHPFSPSPSPSPEAPALEAPAPDAPAPEAPAPAPEAPAPAPPDSPAVGGDHSLDALERAHIEFLLARYGNMSQVARILHINRRTLQRKLKGWGVDAGAEAGEED